MKRLFLALVAAILLVGCNGTPNPPEQPDKHRLDDIDADEPTEDYR